MPFSGQICKILILIAFFLLSDMSVQTVFAAKNMEQTDSVSDTRHTKSIENPEGNSSNIPYAVGSGDKIGITVFGEKDLTDTYTVSNVGTISVPLIGQIDVAGLTLADLEHLVEKKLSDGYLKSPSVSAQIAEYRPFYILGEVRVPGSYSFVSDMSVLNAVALAGGFTYRADKKTVEILRPKQEKSKIVRKIKVDEPVRPGDIILVKERFF